MALVERVAGCRHGGRIAARSRFNRHPDGAIWTVSRRERRQKPRRESAAQSCKPLGKFGCSRSMTRIGARPVGNISALSGPSR